MFFNKIDLFAEKLPRSPLRDYFPDYTGANEDYPGACEFLKNKFVFAGWDVDELKARKEEIAESPELLIGLNGFPRNE